MRSTAADVCARGLFPRQRVPNESQRVRSDGSSWSDASKSIRTSRRRGQMGGRGRDDGRGYGEVVRDLYVPSIRANRAERTSSNRRVRKNGSK